VTTEITVLNALLASIQKAAEYNQNNTVPAAAVLWTDERREWERLVPRLRTLLPHFLVFGAYDKAMRTGPAIWLRCVLADKVPDITWAPGSVPIIYLPGVSRATLRATEECPNELKPLAELQYRGVFWSQYNGKDWTITAFLQTNHGGLQLKIVKDQATVTSIRRAIEQLVDTPLVDLQEKSARGDSVSKVNDCTLDLRRIGRLADEQVVERLTPVKGIGRWTAQMFLIFSLGRPDVFPQDDLGVRTAIRDRYGLPELPDKATCHAIATPWRPYASVASWYCWRSLDLTRNTETVAKGYPS
jgi:hypothetical protein